jgi:hypothetical protein
MTNAQEERNEEEVINNDNDFTETTTETTEESESQDTGPEADETVTLSKSDYDKLQRELAANARLRKEAKERKQAKEGGEKSEEGTSLDRDLIDRTYLAAQAGVKDMDVQDEALRLAKKFGMSVVEALKDPDISSRLENLQKKKKAQAAVAGSTGGAKVANKGMDYYLAEFKRNGSLPDDPKIVAKMMDHLV